MHSTELFAQTAKYLFHIWPNANIKLDCCTDRSSEGDKMYWVTGKSAKSGSQWNLEFSRVQETDRKLTNSFLSHLAFEIGINAGNHPENNPKNSVEQGGNWPTLSFLIFIWLQIILECILENIIETIPFIILKMSLEIILASNVEII